MSDPNVYIAKTERVQPVSPVRQKYIQYAGDELWV